MCCSAPMNAQKGNKNLMQLAPEFDAAIFVAQFSVGGSVIAAGP